MKSKLNFHEFQNCLRIAIVPQYFEKERIKSVLDFCINHCVNHIMFFINAEEYNLGHIIKEEAQPWIETIKRAKKQFEEAGITVSLNPWMEMGHLDRGRRLKEDQKFNTMTDMNGKSCKMVACPSDEKWKAYYFSILQYFIEEIQPEIYWIEDDFRLHNHGDLEFGGCFCPEHMRLYNMELGTNYNREEFVEKVFAKGKMTKERAAWLNVSKKTMLDLAKEIGDCIQRMGFGTRVGLMSSMPKEHCMENRDWVTLHRNLCAGKEIINRIHLPCYTERCGKDYWYDFNSISMVVRSFLPDETFVMPELENAAFSEFAKNSRFLAFQLESAIPLVICGMTYDIFDFVGNGALERLRYGEEIRRITPYLQGVQDLGIKFSQMEGVVVPVFQEACWVRKIEKDWRDLYPEEFEIAGFLGCIGINYKFTSQKKMENETIALIHSVVDEFSDEELIYLFKNNYLLLDGGAIIRLQQRGLGALIGLESCCEIESDSGFQSYEELNLGWIVDGISGYRASAQAKVGNYVKTDFKGRVEIVSKLYDERGNVIGNGMIAGKNFFYIPYIICGKQYELFTRMRVRILTDRFLEVAKKIVRTDECGIAPYLYEQQDKYVLLLINSTVDNFSHVELNLNFDFMKAEYVGRNGKRQNAVYKKCGEKYIFDIGLQYLSTAALLLYK